MKLIKQELDTNDGDYVYAFKVMTDSVYDEFVKGYTAAFAAHRADGDRDIEVYCNSGPAYFSVLTDYTSSLTVSNLTDVEYNVIKNAFGNKFGSFVYLEY